MLKRVLVEIRKYRAIPKDPISLLMELGQVTSKSPTFDISTRNLLSSGCQFLCKASFLYIDKESTGSSKQDAKRAASIEILKALLLDMDEDISLYQDTLFGHSAVQVPMKYPISTSPSNTVEKNYIGMLQEHAQQGLISFPAYIDCKEEGPPHIRTFTVEAKLPREGLKARATGSTKKAAKKDAARMLYEQLQRLWQSSGRNSYGPSFPRVSLGEESPALPSSGPSKGRVVDQYPINTNPVMSDEENYVGLLNEYAQQGVINSPTYTDIREQGPAHIKSFTVGVKLGRDGIEAVGTGSSKKAAKKDAARRMCEKLQKIRYSPARDTQEFRPLEESPRSQEVKFPSPLPNDDLDMFVEAREYVTDRKSCNPRLSSPVPVSSLSSMISQLQLPRDGNEATNTDLAGATCDFLPKTVAAKRESQTDLEEQEGKEISKPAVDGGQLEQSKCFNFDSLKRESTLPFASDTKFTSSDESKLGTGTSTDDDPLSTLEEWATTNGQEISTGSLESNDLEKKVAFVMVGPSPQVTCLGTGKSTEEATANAALNVLEQLSAGERFRP